MGRQILHSLVASVALTATLLITASSAQQQPPPRQQPSAQQPPSRQSASGSATKIDLDELENNPNKFIGRTVTVEGEVDRVLGPNLFTIDERDWADAEREMPVVVPEPFAAVVKTDAPVRVTGTVEKMPIARIAHGLFNDQKIKAEIEQQPVLVASEVIATQTGANLRIQADKPADTSSGQPVTDVNQVAQAKDKELVGKRVELSGVMVTGATNEGFWIRTPSGERIYVLTTSKPTVKEGQQADVKGVVLELPEGLKVQVKGINEPIYIFADAVRPRG
jgi:uncharacterized protein YdeI (BOF family)